MPDLIIIAGPNGAGKTTFAREYLSQGEMRRFAFVNADEIARRWGNGRRSLQPSRAGYGAVCGARRAACLEGRPGPVHPIYYYNVSLFHLRLNSVAESLGRVRRRVEAGGHNIPPEVIERRCHKSSP